jgi:hypothetical protein
MNDSLFDTLPIIGGLIFSAIGAGAVGRALVQLIGTTRENASPMRGVVSLAQVVIGGIFVFQSTRIGEFVEAPWLMPVQLMIALVVLYGSLRVNVPPGFNDYRLNQLAPVIVGAIMFIIGLGWAGQLFKQDLIDQAVLVGALGGGIGVVVLAFSLWRVMREDSAAES